MPYELFISLRYLMAKRREKFISIISLISILGVMVGVTALIVVLAVMSGFDTDLREKIVGANAHIFIEHRNGIANPKALIKEIESIDHVLAATPFVTGEAMIKVNDATSGVLVRGIDSQGEQRVSKISQYLTQGSLDFAENGVVVGSQLAQRFAIVLNSRLSIISPLDRKPHDFEVRGIFTSGMYEYDMSLAFIGLESAQELFGAPDLVSGIGVKIDNLYLANTVKRDIAVRLGPGYSLRTWMDTNRNLFAALKLEKTVMFIILALIVVVACFNIAGTLIMLVMEKTKDIGILKSIGATRKSIRAIFTLQGFIIGLTGTFFGALGGFFICYLLKTYQFIKLPADIYYIDRLPVRLEWRDSLVIILAALVISFLATLYPAWQAARLDPVEALRYE